MSWVAFTALVLAQVGQFDDGQLLGRVCEDLDRDGVCAASEPGVAGAHLLLETGLEAATDAEGRFHFAALSARSAERVAQRLLPGRHRVKLDPGSLVGEWSGVEKGQTVELSAGAALVISFPIARADRRALGLAATPPSFRKAGELLEYELVVDTQADEEVLVAGRPAAGGRAWVGLKPGANLVPVTVSSHGVRRLALAPFDVVARKASLLVVPRALEPVGSVSITSAGEVLFELTARTQVSLDGKPVALDPGGHGRVSIEAAATTLAVRHDGFEWSEPLERPTQPTLLAVGLLDLEASYDFAGRGFGLFGRGAGAVRASFFGFRLGAELDFRDLDVTGGFQPGALLAPHRVEVFERQLDPQRSPLSWADDSATVASNPSEGRFRVELAREGWGRVGYGSTRWFKAGADAGRVHRALQGASLLFQTPTEKTPFGLTVRGVAAPSQQDFSGFARRQAHERFEATGGSLFFLSRAQVVAGSDAVRIEWRDAVTQLPLREVHLQRLRDYTLDVFSGRVLLTRPLSFYANDPLLQADPLTAGAVANLVVDYEYVDLTASGASFGAELRGRLGPVTLIGSGWRDGAYTLFRGAAEAVLGPVRLHAEVAHSAGAIEGLSFSRDGGLTTAANAFLPASGEGWAVTVRGRGKGLFGKGFWDAAWRWRQDGFQDAAQVGALNQVSVRGEQPLGPVVVSALVDFRDLPDPRDPFSGARVQGRVLGGGVGYEREAWGVRLEAREFQQALTEGTRGGFTVGLAGRVRLLPWLQLRAGYRQQLITLGGMELTFASLGVDVKPTEKLELGVRGGWGPALGPQVWGQVNWVRGDETWYGVQSTDADAPSTGEQRLVTGVRQQLDPSTSVFAEDVSATDVNGLRLARAVGLTQRLDDGFSISARYEHGARSLDGVATDVARNAGGLSASYEGQTVKAFVRGELRDETGARVLRQYVVGAGGEWRPMKDLSVTARALWTHSVQGGVMVGRTVDATVSAAWRFERGAVVARYVWTQSYTPSIDHRLHAISLLPTLRFGDRFAVGAGGHLGVSELGPILAGSLRPSVRIWEGLELAGEVAARTIRGQDDSWASLRGEVGYRFDHRFFLGVGFNAFGFSGTGLDASAGNARDRLYLRAEVSY